MRAESQEVRVSCAGRAGVSQVLVPCVADEGDVRIGVSAVDAELLAVHGAVKVVNFLGPEV